jgi:hypothetical protein
VIVYCSQALSPNLKVNSTKETITNNSVSNNSTSSLAAASDKKLICTVVSKIQEGRCDVEKFMQVPAAKY